MWDDRDLANYIVGQADADSSFVITIMRCKGNKYGLRVLPLWVTEKHGDTEVLEKIHDFLGVGRVYAFHGKSHPYIALRVAGRDCAQIVQFFEQFPLRGRKREDFEIWKKAVELYVSHEKGRQWTRHELSQIIKIRHNMESTLKYRRRCGDRKSATLALQQLS
jgi:hypothetical protein